MELFSGVGKVYEKCKKVKPLNKTQRERVYASCEMSYDNKRDAGVKKFSPFNTVSRESRNSYLLRVTKEPNCQTNYEINQDPVLHRERRATIDQAKFKRIIGPVNDRDYSIEIKSNRDHRCQTSSLPYSNKKPLNMRETHKWRKTLQNLDFKKQVDPERCNAHDYLKSMKSTQDSFMLQTLQQTTESNFNNYKRFSLAPKADKSHDFKSYSGHQYLKRVLNREIEPEYDIVQSNEQFFRQSMRSPRGEMRFDLNRQKIVTRVDRSDPHWAQILNFEPEVIIQKTPREIKTIDYDLTIDREMNEVHSKYPIRQSLKPYVPLNKAN